MRLTLFLFIFPIFLSAQQKRVLFIGNSYTFVNNLPQLVADLALSNGDTVYADSYAPGGYTFLAHFNDANARSKISGAPWTHVVLQAQSQEASFSPGQVAAQTLPYAIRLDSLVKAANPCAITIFYETWGRKNGDGSNCANYPPVCTYTGMQNRLRSSYKIFADTCKAIMAPVGEAWRSSITYSPALELYQTDQSHPVLEGSFLAAAVIYEGICRRSALTATYNPGIPSNVHTFLLQRAHQTVNDSLLTWNIGRFDPDPGFSLLQSGSTISLTATNGSNNHSWDFGDGNSSILVNPVHQYSSPGTYTVTHVVADSCQSVKEKKVLSVYGTVGVFEYKDLEAHVSKSLLFSNELRFSPSTSVNSKIRIVDLQGITIWVGTSADSIQTGNWPLGMYLMLEESNSSMSVRKLIKGDQP